MSEEANSTPKEPEIPEECRQKVDALREEIKKEGVVHVTTHLWIALHTPGQQNDKSAYGPAIEDEIFGKSLHSRIGDMLNVIIEAREAMSVIEKILKLNEKPSEKPAEEPPNAS